MTGLDFSGLGDLAKGTTKGKKGWTPLTLDDLGDGIVLGMDQSLTASGWVLLAKFGPEIEVVVTGVLSGGYDEEKSGLLTSLKRGVALESLYRSGPLDAAIRANAEVAHESPPTPGRTKDSGISSLLSALAFRIACAAEGIEPLMYGAQPAKALVCGNANAKKAEAHAALRSIVFPWIPGSHLVTNEAKRDALMICLLHLARRRK